MSETSKTFYRDRVDCSEEDADRIDTFAATLGFGPKYKPTPPRTYTCPSCKKTNAYCKEIHPDTGMDEIVSYCPDCRKTVENGNKK